MVLQSTCFFRFHCLLGAWKEREKADRFGQSGEVDDCCEGDGGFG